MTRKLIFSLLFSLCSTTLFALPFGSFDARSLAMGGTGVAAGEPSSASHYNPALLASTYNDNDFSLIIPAFIFGPLDLVDLKDTVDNFNNANYPTALDTAVTNFNNSSTATEISSTATAIATASQNLLNGINGLADAASITIQANAAVLFAVPNQTLGVSAYTSVRIIGGTNIDFTTADTAKIQSYIDVLSCLGKVDPSLSSGTTAEKAQYATNVATCYALSPGVIDSSTGDFTNTDVSNSLTSSVKARGAFVQETGLSLAHTFPSLYYASLGITPKTVEVETFDTSVSINSASVSTKSSRKKYSNFNFDFGAVIPFSNNFKVAAVIKNIISKNYETVLGNTISIKPQLRVGAAFQNEWFVITTDFDLTRNKSVAFEKDTQYAAIGAEFDLYNAIQLRLGYRNNRVSPDKVSSIGLGFSSFVKTDVAIASGKEGYEVGLQLGFAF